MKKLLCIGALAIGFAGSVQAQKYGMSGCGLGSIVIKDHKSKLMQLVSVTLNGTGYQTFGITSGTSNCTSAAATAKLQEQEHFIVQNLEVLSKDMAQGQGESLQAFAEVLGCPTAVYPEFSKTTQESFSAIFASPGSRAVLEKTKDVIRENQTLSASCNAII